MKYFLYLLTNKSKTVLYLGVTNNLKRRIIEHKEGINSGFTKKDNCKILLWFQEFTDIRVAIEQEKRIKKWKRRYKENLINQMNPAWVDLLEFL